MKMVGPVQNRIMLPQFGTNITALPQRAQVHFGADRAELTPRVLEQEIGKYVKGQPMAVRRIAMVFYEHLLKNNLIPGKPQVNLDKIRKSNILFLGPTGAGKTQIIRALEKIITKYKLELPLVRRNATELTEAGYIGGKVEDIACALYEKAGGDLEKAKQGVMFIDEIDKKFAREANETGRPDVSGAGVQDALLQVMEDGEINIDTGRTKGKAFSSLPTKNVLVILAGAFTNLPNIIKKRLNDGKEVKGEGKLPVGFDSQPERHVKLDEDTIYQNVIPQDLIDCGFKPEFIGRIDALAALNKLSIPALKDVLLNSKDSVLKQINEILKPNGIDVVFTPDALDKIAQYAYKTGTGARALPGILNYITEDIRFNAPDLPDAHQVINAEKVQTAIKAYTGLDWEPENKKIAC